jgi:hypothetical protein
MKVGVPYTIKAQVAPAVAGVKVILSNGASAVTDDSGAVIFTVTNSSSGFVPYQLSIAPDQNFSATQTAFVIVWAR